MTKLKISQKNEGTAYLVHSNDWNKILNTARLTEDYSDIEAVGRKWLMLDHDKMSFFDFCAIQSV